MSDDLHQVLRPLMPAALADLEALVRIPSVSSDPCAAGELRRCAELTATLFRRAGAQDVEILDGVEGGKPAVLAHYPAPRGAPTVLLYAHHDVQPAGDPAQWSSPPFEPARRGGRLYGRGTADDKAGIAAHLAAIRAHGCQPPVGVTVLVEGEEEISSPTLGAFIARHRDQLAADIIVLADSENLEIGIPSFTTSLRGIAACLVELTTLRHGVHSGGYGGAAPDALTALCRLLATLHDENGDVAIEGLHTAKPSKISYPEGRFRAEAAMLDGVPLLGTGTIAEQIWAKPAATVLAIDAPPVATASNTLTPTARAKISLRLAPGEDAARAQQALAQHLRRHAPWGLQVNVTDGDLGKPFAIEADGPAFDAARRAYGKAYGAKVVDIGGGGTIPFVAEFAHAFPAAAILVTSGGADPSSRAHSTDESLDLAEFERACLAEALLLTDLARS